MISTDTGLNSEPGCTNPKVIRQTDGVDAPDCDICQDVMDRDEKTKAIRLVVVIIAVALAAAGGLILSPLVVRVWVLAIASVLVTIVAGLKSAAVSISFFHRRNRLLGVLWGGLALILFLLLLVDVQHVVELAW